jgi:putative transposase
MNTREMAMEYRMTSWAQALSERAAEKESINEFCRRKGVSKNTYFYWQRKLREAGVKELEAKRVETAPALPPSGWAQISGARGIEKTEDIGVLIEIGKSRVRASESTDMELLRKICGVLVSLC